LKNILKIEKYNYSYLLSIENKSFAICLIMTESDKQKIIKNIKEITNTFESFITSESSHRKSSYISIIKNIIDDLQKFVIPKNKLLKDDIETIESKYNDIKKRIEKLINEQQLVKKRKIEDEKSLKYFSSIIQILKTFEYDFSSIKIDYGEQTTNQLIIKLKDSLAQLNEDTSVLIESTDTSILSDLDYEPLESSSPSSSSESTKRIKSLPSEILNGTTYIGGGLQRTVKPNIQKGKMFKLGDIIKFNHIFYCIVSVKNIIKKKVQKHTELKLMAVSSRHIRKNSQNKFIFTPKNNPFNGEKYVCIFLETKEHYIYKQDIINSFELIDTVDYVSTFVYGDDENKLSKDMAHACDKSHEFFDFVPSEITESKIVLI
jgi:ElaB/YqjD/DUF883 family membrane-anchored ribosome-binding protein